MTATTDTAADLELYGRQAEVFAQAGKAEALHECLHAHPALLKGHGDALLRIACAHGHLDCVTELLAHNVSVTHTDASGLAPIDHAAKHHHWPLVESLLEAGSSPDGSPRITRHGAPTPLMYAASDGNIAMMHRLKTAGATPRYRDAKGQNLIFYAARAPHHAAECIGLALTWLHVPHISKRDLVNSKDHTGETPLHSAARARSAGAIEALVALGGDASIENVLRQKPADLTSGHACVAAFRPVVQEGLFNDHSPRPSR